MRTARLARVLISAFVTSWALTVVAMPTGVAVADPAEDDHFLALLEQQDIPAIDGLSRLIYRAKLICDQLDSGTPVPVVVNQLNDTTFGENMLLRLQADRVTRTSTKFIIASVGAYCPRNQGLLPPPP